MLLAYFSTCSEHINRLKALRGRLNDIEKICQKLSNVEHKGLLFLLLFFSCYCYSFYSYDSYSSIVIIIMIILIMIVVVVFFFFLFFCCFIPGGLLTPFLSPSPPTGATCWLELKDFLSRMFLFEKFAVFIVFFLPEEQNQNGEGGEMEVEKGELVYTITQGVVGETYQRPFQSKFEVSLSFFLFLSFFSFLSG